MTTASRSTLRIGRAIFWSGLVAGVLDISYVFMVFHPAAPQRLLQGIAATLLGRDAARAGGWSSAALGLAMHFAIAYAVAAVFCLASRQFPALVKRPVISGITYGVAVWLVMNLAILPLVNATKVSFPPPQWEKILLAHVICVGLPIAFVARRFSR